MIPLSAHARIVRKSEDLVFYVSAPGRRVMFFVLFLVLAASMAAGFDVEVDLAGARALKTAGYSLVLLVLLGTAGWSGATGFDRRSGKVETISRLFGVPVRRKVLTPISRIDRVVIQKVALLHETPPGGRRGVFGGLFEPRSELHRLFLVTGEGRIDLDEGGNTDVLKQTAAYLSEFLGVEFIQEELFLADGES